MFSPIMQYGVDSHANLGRLRMVQTVGCLVHSSGRWTLTHATQPHDTDAQSTTAAATAVSAISPLGSGTFELLGTQVFKADRYQQQKVVVKGVEISAATGSRMNITSLQPASQPCRE